MARAIWNGAVIAESDDFQVVEGNVYFPPESLSRDYLRPTEQTSTCFWKGKANYFDVVVDGETNAGAAWYYAEPKKRAENSRGHVAFWRGVEVER